MALIFISHSHVDNELASDVQNYLEKNGFAGNIFLDTSKQMGIRPGSDWETTLYRRVESSAAVVILLTKEWHNSKWCFVEYTQARALGKLIIPLIAQDNVEKLAGGAIQHVSILENAEDGFKKLASELARAALDVQGGFSWDHSRSPFPGLLPFDANDAAIFFGRNAETRTIIERLNARKNLGGTKVLVLSGPSGVGKSSLIRAGILPRLGFDDANWIISPPFRPGLDPVNGLTDAVCISLHCTPELIHSSELILRRVQEIRHRKILIAIDQAEELFYLSKHASEFYQLWNFISSDDFPFVFVIGLRSDYIAAFQTICAKYPRLAFDNIPIGPFQDQNVRAIIEEPAKIAGVQFEKALVDRLVQDFMQLSNSEERGSTAVLPMMALTLNELYNFRKTSSTISLNDYKVLGASDPDISPLEQSITWKIRDILGNRQITDQEIGSVRRTFVTQFIKRAGDTHVRQPVALSAISRDALRIIDEFEKARLITFRADTESYEIAHESLIKNWAMLRRWVDTYKELYDWQDSKFRPNFYRWETLKDFEVEQIFASAKRFLEDHPIEFTNEDRTQFELLDKVRKRKNLNSLIKYVSIIMAIPCVAVFITYYAYYIVRDMHLIYLTYDMFLDYHILSDKETNVVALKTSSDRIVAYSTVNRQNLIDLHGRKIISLESGKLSYLDNDSKFITKDLQTGRNLIEINDKFVQYCPAVNKLIFVRERDEQLTSNLTRYIDLKIVDKISGSVLASRSVPSYFYDDREDVHFLSDCSALIDKGQIAVQLNADSTKFSLPNLSEIELVKILGSDGDRAVIEASNNRVFLMRLNDDRSKQEVDHEKELRTTKSITFTKDGKYFFLNIVSKAAIWDGNTGKLVMNLAAEKLLCFDLSSKYILTRSYENRLSVWNVAKKEVVSSFYVPGSLIISASFFDDNKIYTIAEDNSLVEWDLRTGRSIRAF